MVLCHNPVYHRLFVFPSELTYALCIFKIVCYHVISWNIQSVTQFFYYFLVLKTSKNNSTEQLKSDKMLHDRSEVRQDVA